MTNEEQRLADLRAKMSEKQRREMAEIVQNEMRRRGLSHDDEKPAASKKKPDGLNRDQVGELYADLNDAVKQLRVKKLEEKVAKHKKTMKSATGGLISKFAAAAPKAPRIEMPRMLEPTERNTPIHPDSDEDRESNLSKMILMGGVFSFGIMKIAFSSGLMPTTLPTGVVLPPVAASAPVEVKPVAKSEAQLLDPKAPVVIDHSSDKQMLLELDARRVELEQRKDGLDRREQDLKAQNQALSERLAELRSLTAKLSDTRKERDVKFETRMAQIGNVYGAMNPNEAAVLIARLDDDVAIELLQRMPEKRMGQILSFMDQDRAVDLTKILTDRTK